MNQHILLATDGTETSAQAEEHALQLSGLCGAKLTILHVLDDHLCHYGKVDTLAPLEARESFVDYVIEEQQQSSKTIEENLTQKSKLYQSSFKFEVQQGDPVVVVADYVNKENFDWVIIGGKRNKMKRGFRTLSFADKLNQQTNSHIITVT